MECYTFLSLLLTTCWASPLLPQQGTVLPIEFARESIISPFSGLDDSVENAISTAVRAKVKFFT